MIKIITKHICPNPQCRAHNSHYKVIVTRYNEYGQYYRAHCSNCGVYGCGFSTQEEAIISFWKFCLQKEEAEKKFDINEELLKATIGK